MMRMDVSGMNYADLQKAFDNAIEQTAVCNSSGLREKRTNRLKWAVYKIERRGDSIVLECALS